MPLTLLRLLVCGGRDYQDADRVDAVLSRVHAERTIVCIIEGGARGADWLAAQWAKANRVQHKRFPANWERDGRRAGSIRNALMLQLGAPHAVIAFPGGNGTADMIRKARAANVPVWEIAP